MLVPRMIAAGDQAAKRFLEFFAATICNKNTRMALPACGGKILRLVRSSQDWRDCRYRAAERKQSWSNLLVFSAWAS
jgi:hypothetical protein